ncbi:MAG: hypothetical protein HXX11_13895 [Desulfuromonadales bacterium]|nr:hypothetical protein [Desulfuromonadales bacterium]
MIIGKYFDGDCDDKLKMFQHGCYYDLLREWITMAGVRRLRYRTSPEWTEVTQVWERFRDEGYYDHRTIQATHDLIAAQFRLVAQETSLPDAEKEDAWITFFKAEASEWLSHDGFLRLFMIALSAKGSTIGYDAEDAIFEMMKMKYHELNYVVLM